jgi:hypothetical protein
LHSAAALTPARHGDRHAYIKSETFRASGRSSTGGRIARTLAAPGFLCGWPALCVKVRTTVDDVTNDRFKQRTYRTGLNHLRKATDRGRIGEYAAQALKTAGIVDRAIRDGIVRATRIT